MLFLRIGSSFSHISEKLSPAGPTVRGMKVILDSDLARIYGVTTSRLNEQVRRNRDRFPDDFMFRLTRDEYNLISQNATSSSGHGGRTETTGRAGREARCGYSYHSESDTRIDGATGEINATNRLPHRGA